MAVLAVPFLLGVIGSTFGEYVLTIYPQETKVGDVTHYDEDRWVGKNGIDPDRYFQRLKDVGTYGVRWANSDFRNDFYIKAHEDPHRKGYPDPSYFMAHQHDPALGNSVVNYEKAFGNPEIIMAPRGLQWPHWVPTSQHHGRFPNSVDVAAEFMSLMVQTISKGMNGKLPAFLEVINEPDWEKQNTNWTTYNEYHKAVANKLKPKFPHFKIGGPTMTSDATSFDKADFKTWKMIVEYLDMAFTSALDFFSYHSYTVMVVKGNTHEFYRNSEAKISGLLDLVESYSYKKRNKPYDVIISEFGLGPIVGIDTNKPADILDWGYIYHHNAQLFAFLDRRDVVRKVAAFLLTYSHLEGPSSINYSIFDGNGNERAIGQAFRLWKPLTDSMTYLRVDSQFHNAERKILSHVLIDKASGTLMVLLHNHDTKPTQVKLNFINGWFHPNQGTSTCEYKNAQGKATLDQNKPVHVTNSAVTVPAETTCFYKFHTSHKFSSPLLTQSTYYSRDMVIPIHGNVEVHVNIPTIGNSVAARLRIGVSLANKHGNPKPKSVQFNQHTLTSFYSLHTNNHPWDPTLWETYEFQVPVNIIRTNNDVKMSFAQSGGYVSSVALVIGRH